MVLRRRGFERAAVARGRAGARSTGCAAQPCSARRRLPGSARAGDRRRRRGPGSGPRASLRSYSGVSRRSERGDSGAERLQGRDRREGRPPDAGLVDQHHRGRSGPPHPRRQRAAAVHQADARQGGQGHEDGDDLHAGVRGDGRHLARQRPLRAGRPAREAVHADDGQPRIRTSERTGRSAPSARSEGRRQLHDGGHAAHVGRRGRRPQRSRHPRGARVARRQALLHHQRQRRGPAATTSRRTRRCATTRTTASFRCSARRPAGSGTRKRRAATSPARPSKARTSICSPAACATRCTSTGTPTARSSRSTATWSRSSACRGTARCACSGCRAAPISATAATAASIRPGTRTRCRRSWRSDWAARWA